MNEFIASNGIRVRLRETGTEVNVQEGFATLHLSAAKTAALREFFQHERDIELGRWRWPENPDYVVYRFSERRDVRVLRESTATHFDYTDNGAWSSVPSDYEAAARAYFDAHPERKPWHDAKEGEVWVLKEHGQPDRAYLVDGSQFYDYSRDYALDFEDSVILDARRIWPEDDS